VLLCVRERSEVASVVISSLMRPKKSNFLLLAQWVDLVGLVIWCKVCSDHPKLE
jgi:hypothetical protein